MWDPVLLFLLSAAAPSPASSAPDSWLGRYGRHFMNEVYGQKEPADDVLEIVPAEGQGDYYFRGRFHFHNDHKCTPQGIAHWTGSAFVYHEPQVAGTGPACTLKIVRQGDRITFRDSGSCKILFCGANGTLEGSSLPLRSRRPITYMDRLKASETYERALDEHVKVHGR